MLPVAVAAEIIAEDLAVDPVDLTLVQVQEVLVLPPELLLCKAADLAEVVEEMVLMVLMVVLVSFLSHTQPDKYLKT